MLEHIVLGAIQGVTEWIPVSSKACVIAAKIHFFKSTGSLNELINYALFLHLGTFFAALAYFWKDIKNILLSVTAPQGTSNEGRKILVFLATTTVLTGLGQILINNVSALTQGAPQAKLAITFLIASLLIVAGILQLKTKTSGQRTPGDLKFIDGVFLGLVQAIATLPGLSRAGTTMAALSLRNFDKENTLKLSFLMSMPVILIGNLVKNYKSFLHAGSEWVGVIVAFVVGILTINALMNFARRVNFGAFLIFIGSVLAIAAMCGFID
ncbi:MAG: undecaprenyl-diphosphate phosphatase [Candidatus Omnitrophica bacterium]|nr:undecaprenyl-diphosphate phosphatase [Candidatus Omnitrophota bacterium]